MGATLGYRGKRSGGPWWGDERRRLVFELGARRFFSELNGRSGKGSRGEGRYYRLRLDVPGFDSRMVEIVFSKQSTTYPDVYVDGPEDSPHRYRVGGEESTLCMWYPQDPPDQKWTLEDGLHELLALIAAHLFREAWWREYGEWLGPVSPHAVPKAKAKND
jgi:hypothetical protein